MVAGCADLDALARVAATTALLRCPSTSIGGSGTVSHALLGVAAARRLAERMVGPRSRLPLAQAALFVTAEAGDSPYVATPWSLPVPGPAAPELAAALEAGDVAGADGWVVARGLSAAPALATAAVAHLGHLGHRAIFVSSALSLAGHAPQLLRAPARYLASHQPTDDTAGAVTLARSGLVAGPVVGPIAARIREGEAPGSIAGALLDAAVQLVADCAQVEQGIAHLITMSAAVGQLAAVHPDPAEALLAGAVWLDQVVAGSTELGPWAPRRRAEPLQPRAGTLPQLASAIGAGDREAAGSLALSLPSSPELWALLVEEATKGGATTVQHTLKLTASVPDTPQGRSVACRYLAWAQGSGDPLYLAAIEALGLQPR